MNMLLKRQEWLSDGILGILASEDLKSQWDTIEHAYLVEGNWMPKIPVGVYKCIRYKSPHFGYYVFEITGVPNCTNIEIHIANTEAQVEGCVGIGKAFGKLSDEDAVLRSRDAFDEFMKLQTGVDEFQLTVV